MLSLCRHHHHRRLHAFSLHPLQARLKSPSRLDIAGKRRPPSTNLKNTSNSQQKISKPAIQFSGGPADVLNSQIYSAWPATSCVFLVSFTCQSTGCINIYLKYFQALLSPLREFSRAVVTQFRSGVLAFMPTQSEYSCLSRSGCTLPVPKPMPPCAPDLILERNPERCQRFEYAQKSEVSIQRVLRSPLVPIRQGLQF
jgi:hypothetical protein